MTPSPDDGIVVVTGGRESDVDMSGNDQVLSAEAARLERRLTEEILGLRAELHEQIAAVRTELAGFRLEMHDGFAALRHELHDMRADILKWSFLFWIGQVAAIAGLLAFILRAVGANRW